MFKFEEKSDSFHFFASSVAEWKVDANLESLLRTMKRDNFPFNVYRVELPLDADYDIRQFIPDVEPEKLTLVGRWYN